MYSDVGPELVMGRVHPWVGSGRVGSKTVTLPNPCLLMIYTNWYQSIKKWHRRDL